MRKLLFCFRYLTAFKKDESTIVSKDAILTLVQVKETVRVISSYTPSQDGNACFKFSILETSVSDPDPVGSVSFGRIRIRIIWSDPDPYQETWIWIRVAPKINQNHGINKSK